MRIIKTLLTLGISSLIFLLPTEPQSVSHPASVGELVSTVEFIEKHTALAQAPIELASYKTIPKAPKPATATQEAPNKDHPCGDNEYARKIYTQESGCSLTSTNSIGCIGLGQSCPASKLSNACPNWRTDYDCQNKFFTNYAMGYGGWKQAHDFKYCMGSCYSTRTKNTQFKQEIWW